MGKKKAIIYYGGFLSKSGGAFYHAKNLKEQLEQNSWSVKVYTLDDLPLLLKYLPAFFERLINLIKPPLGFIVKGKLTQFLYKTFLKGYADLVVFEDIYISWNNHSPSVTLLHAVWSDNLQAFNTNGSAVDRLKKHEANCLNNINHPVVTVSGKYCEFLQSKHFANYNLKKINIIPLGIDQSSFSNTSEHKTKKSLIYTGSLEARKNLNFLLNTFSQVYNKDPEYRLTLVGDGPDRSALEKKAKELKLPVTFLGRLSYAEVQKELPKHEIYIHTSTKESFSFSLLEAKLSGLKTVAYGQLEVPTEFIDLKLSRFDESLWANAILSEEFKENDFNPTLYTSKSMTESTLELVLRDKK